MQKVLLFLTILWIAIQSGGAAETAQLNLRAVVRHSMKVDINVSIEASNIDLNDEPVLLEVASVKELTNSYKSYDVRIQSKNNGYLVSATSSEKIPYKIYYEADEGTGKLLINTPGNSDVNPGEYSDQIYYTILKK